MVLLSAKEELGTALVEANSDKLNKLEKNLRKKSDKQLKVICEKYDAPEREKLKNMGKIGRMLNTIGNIYSLNSTPFDMIDKAEYYTARHILHQRAWRKVEDAKKEYDNFLREMNSSRHI